MNGKENGEKFVQVKETEKPEIEKSPEENEAEKEAMDKVVDLVNFPILSHITTFNNAEKIPGKGMLYQKLAQRAQQMGIQDIDFKQAYPELSETSEKIYFYFTDCPHGSYNRQLRNDRNGENLKQWLEHYDQRERKEQGIQLDSGINLLVNPDGMKLLTDEYAGEATPAVYSRKRVKDKQMIGLYLSDFKNRSKDSIDKAVKLAKKLKVPIYFEGPSLYWPKKLDYPELLNKINSFSEEEKMQKPKFWGSWFISYGDETLEERREKRRLAFERDKGDNRCHQVSNKRLLK